MKIDIPERGILDIQNLIFDFNGTLATDSIISQPVQQRLRELSASFELYVLTADTNGTAARQCAQLNLPLKLKTFPNGQAALEKAEFVKKLGPENCACYGNGFNDAEMFSIAKLAIGVMGEEGIHGKLLQYADLVVSNIYDGLGLFTNPMRLIAGLRA